MACFLYYVTGFMKRILYRLHHRSQIMFCSDLNTLYDKVGFDQLLFFFFKII